jgi:hypothetical protein
MFNEGSREVRSFSAAIEDSPHYNMRPLFEHVQTMAAIKIVAMTSSVQLSTP